MHHSACRSPIIKVKGLTKRYQIGDQTVNALRGVDLTVHRGDLLAIMGPSGSGKSTLLHLLGCLDSPSSGSYFLDDEEVSNLSDDALAHIRATKIGFVFQSFNLIPQLTVLENVEIPFLYQKAKQQDLTETLTQALAKVGLSHRLHHHPTELSGGEMQRVAIARALATNPLLIFADEPTGNLDSGNGKAILQLFSDLNQQGVTIIIVTHDASVGANCRRLIRMQDGSIVNDGN